MSHSGKLRNQRSFRRTHLADAAAAGMQNKMHGIAAPDDFLLALPGVVTIRRVAKLNHFIFATSKKVQRQVQRRGLPAVDGAEEPLFAAAAGEGGALADFAAGQNHRFIPN